MTSRIRSVLALAVVLLAVVYLAPYAVAEPSGAAGTVRIVRADPRFDRLVPREAVLEKVADGFAWVEGPVWHRSGGFLLFSDIPSNSVFRWKPGAGVSLVLRPSGYTGRAPFAGREPGANGLTFDPAGRLVLAEHGDRRIARLEPDGRKTTLVDRYQGRRLNSPNDLVYASNGDLYFTDPPFGLPRAFDDPDRELPFSAVFRLSARGELTLLTRDLRAPNGIALSPDERTLYVSNADRDRAVWMAYDILDGGTLANGRVFFDATTQAQSRKGAPDGMKVDQAGNLFAAGPGGVHVLAPDGTHLGILDTGGVVSNVAWGDDGSVLYLTADTAIYRIRLATRGAGFVRGAAASAVACHAPEAAASYRVTFRSDWSAATHPDGFPTGAHFSDLIGATHRATWTPWAVGALASPGIERMAEAGKSRPLADEVRAAIKAGQAGAWIAGDGIKRSPGGVSLDLRVSREFPLVSLVSMLAPSPDWFVGVAGLDLCEAHRWVWERMVALYAYDAGTDSGTVYEAADVDTQPREPIRRIEWPPFRVGGELRPVGTLTVTRR